MLLQLRRSFLTPLIALIFVVIAAFIVDRSFNAYIQLVFLYICINIILALSLNLVNGFTGQFSILDRALSFPHGYRDDSCRRTMEHRQGARALQHRGVGRRLLRHRRARTRGRPAGP